MGNTVSEWDGDVVHEIKRLDAKQEARLMRLTAALRDDPFLMAQVADLKIALKNGVESEAAENWWGLEEWEQSALWVAPLYGGIFTTEERKQIRNLRQ